MKISKQKLLRESSATEFRPEILEKVWYLMDLLDAINDHSFLKEKLVLKGGTALNLFMFDLPRLSVDIDLNYRRFQLLSISGLFSCKQFMK